MHPSVKLIWISILTLGITSCSFSKQYLLDDIELFVTDQGFEIIEYEGKIAEFEISDESICDIDMALTLTLVNINPKRHLNKTAEIYHFIVKNHRLEELYEEKHKINGTNIYIWVIDDKIIGGSSCPNTEEPLYGCKYSIEGYALEEVTGETYLRWLDSVEKRCRWYIQKVF